ncbi:unnamed protein product [Moneuplotes crassus]|uniref:THH1/TOM1/TOM3 domain-containing protein n=2 Tax=Euplotes crassus TaxID=5936 RepID=A0AAD1UK19_EUPCR|nr:unnamed protein product [Moneuplotes crassus]
MVVTMSYMIYKNLRLGQKEFYRMSILFFISLAYLIRIAEFLYTMLALNKDTFNRSSSDEAHNKLLVLLYFSPLAMHCLGGILYLSRWIHYLFISHGALNTNPNDPLEQKRMRTIHLSHRIILFTIIVISLVMILIVTFLKAALTTGIIYYIACYILVAIGLQIISILFLKRLKKTMFFLYKQKKTTIICYSYLVSFCMIFRSFSCILDLALNSDDCYKDNECKEKPINYVNDIILLACYFMELIPSLMITVVLRKTNVELQYKKMIEDYQQKSSQALLDPEDMNERKYTDNSANNRSNNSSNISRVMSEDDSFTPNNSQTVLSKSSNLGKHSFMSMNREDFDASGLSRDKIFED